jgi:hypothetical protein
MECLGADSLVESLDSAKDGFTSTISGFRMPFAPRCSVRGAARFARRTTVHFRHEQTTYESVGPKIKVRAYASVGHRKSWRGISPGWPIIWKNAGRVKARLPLSNQPLAQFPLSELFIRNSDAAFRAGNVGFDLAADFLCSIVTPDDLMTV